MHDNNSIFDGSGGIIIALIVLLALALLFGGKPSGPTNTDYNLNYHYETHTTNTNIDICGICINTDR